METSNPNEEEQAKEKMQISDSIKQLCLQIRNMSEQSRQTHSQDKRFSNRLQDLKMMMQQVSLQFKEQKKAILQRLNHWMLPIAKEVLDEMLQDFEQMKTQLKEKIEQSDQVSSGDWEKEERQWSHLYFKWSDRKAVMKQIVEVVKHRTSRLIDKDIQVIKEYQQQSLSYLEPESEAFKDVERRLAKAIEAPLKELHNLKIVPVEHVSLQQASEWVKTLQVKRETYFNQSLTKIDHVLQDVVHQVEEDQDWSAFVEDEGELLFMEKELHQMNQELVYVHLIQPDQKQYLVENLLGLSHHLESVYKDSLPLLLQERIEKLQEGIEYALERLEKA